MQSLVTVLLGIVCFTVSLCEAQTCSARPCEQCDGTVLPLGAGNYFSERQWMSPRLHPFSVDSNARLEAIREATLHAWTGYRTYAMGKDELLPLSKRGEDTLGGLGATVVDSLSTLYVIGFHDEFLAARDWVSEKLDFSKVGEVIVFETVIRILGGLLSAYHLTGDQMFLSKAEDLGGRLGKCFQTKTGLPFPRCTLNSTTCTFHTEYGSNVLLAEIGTLQLEFRALSYHTLDRNLQLLRYQAEDVVKHLDSISPRENKGMIPYLLNINTGQFVNQYITLGSPSDSYFEYLLKVYLQGGRQERLFRDKFLEVVDGIMTYMRWNVDEGYTVIREVTGTMLNFSKVDHFTCYLPGVIYLGLELAPSDLRPSWFSLAENVTRTCYGMYEWSASGLAAENIQVFMDGTFTINGGYLLRPEVIEAFFYMWRATHNPIYREWGWKIFERIQHWCRTDEAYTTLQVADSELPEKSDLMPSFFISETLKYLYLLFSEDDVLPLDKWVFNTEGHPLLITPGLVGFGDGKT